MTLAYMVEKSKQILKIKALPPPSKLTLPIPCRLSPKQYEVKFSQIIRPMETQIETPEACKSCSKAAFTKHNLKGGRVRTPLLWHPHDKPLSKRLFQQTSK